MPLDVARARSETPGCERVLHFNNAGAALMPRPVLEAVQGHLDLEARIGGYEAAAQAREALEGFYGEAAALMGCAREEVAFAENATRAWDMAFYGIAFARGDRILTSRGEYASNYIAFLQVAKRTGARVEVVPDDAQGQLSVEALERMLDGRVKLVAINHVPTQGGLVQPAAEVGKVCRDAGVLYLLDACQSVGQMPLDMQRLGCDFLSGTGRKFLRGPRATGFLVARRAAWGRVEPPFLDLHAARWVEPERYELSPDARRFEAWEQNLAGKLGLAAAMRYARGWGIEDIWARVRSLAEQLRTRLAELPGVEVRDTGAQRCGIVTFTVQGREPWDLQRRLAARRVHVYVIEPDSALLDLRARGLPGVVRASVHYYNAEEEVERFCDELAALL